MILAFKEKKIELTAWFILHANIDIITHDPVKCKESSFIDFTLISLLLSNYSVDSTA